MLTASACEGALHRGLQVAGHASMRWAHAQWLSCPWGPTIVAAPQPRRPRLGASSQATAVGLSAFSCAEIFACEALRFVFVRSDQRPFALVVRFLID